ncbi:MAG TPA: hypothetical protein VE467_00960, partial [Chryseolinea sp.]|nr:hypothetical protein [Chryseolinea sp.]
IDPILNDFQNSFPDPKCVYRFSEINKRGIGGHNASGLLQKLIQHHLYLSRNVESIAHLFDTAMSKIRSVRGSERILRHYI